MVIKYTYSYICLEKKSEQIITLLLIIINYFSPRSSVVSYFQSYTDFTFHYLCWLEVVRICFFFLCALILHLHVIGIDSITEKNYVWWHRYLNLKSPVLLSYLRFGVLTTESFQSYQSGLFKYHGFT